jgi:beta-lactamase regulating signal transducer with metallopeptidase domain
MLTLSLLLLSSIVWGGLIWLSARALQRSNISGRARQWIWRGATLLLIAPWISAPFVFVFGWGLAPHAAPLAGDPVPAAFVVEPAVLAPVADTVGISVAAAPVAIDPVQVILLVLAAGWLVRFVLAQLAARSLLGIVQHAREAAQGLSRNALGAWSRRLGMRRQPRMLVVAENVSPFSFGVLRPTICLPEGLEERLKPEALDLVIAHECTHVARGDGWLRPLERVAADVLWFNPFAWLMRRELDVARELACDEAVVDVARDRRVYARTLRDIAGFTACLPATVPAASMSLAGGSLMLRVTRTLGLSDRKPARLAVVSACVLALAGAPLAVAQVMFVTPAPPAPVAPPAPTPPSEPAAAVYTTDGTVRASFPAKVVATNGDAAKGYTIRLEGIGESEGCTANMSGLGSLDTANGQTLAEGDIVGRRPASGPMKFEVKCSDGAYGGIAPVAPVPPAAAVRPTMNVAPVAPVAPVLALAAVAAPTPPMPFATGAMNQTPPAPIAPPAPVSPVTAVTPPTPAVAPVAPVPATPAVPAIAPPAPVAPVAAPEAPAAPEAAPPPPAPPELLKSASRADADMRSPLREMEARGMSALAGGQAMLPPSTFTQSSGVNRTRRHEPATQRNGYPRNLVVTRPN